ncbi:MAG: carbohydrate ABC transporter permease [Clostridiaceae bacterium]|nr:carbohydrate ABC transporter permease [Clostridiaceae bacterium]
MFNVIKSIYLIFAGLVVLFPLLNVVSSSLSEPAAVIGGRVTIFPIGINLEAYKYIFQSKDLITGFLNTVLYTVTGTIINITLTMMAAYPLSRKELSGREVIIAFLFFTMIFEGGMIPTFLVVRDLGMYNTRWAMIIPTTLSVWNVMIAKSFFQNTFPSELYEAAEIDGCSELGIFLKIVLPLSGSIIAVLVLFYAVGHWNSYFNGLIYIKDKNLQPLQVVLRNILASTQYMSEMVDQMTTEQLNRLSLVEVMKYAIIVAGNLPVAILYPFIQKHFTKGIFIGSIKG